MRRGLRYGLAQLLPPDNQSSAELERCNRYERLIASQRDDDAAARARSCFPLWLLPLLTVFIVLAGVSLVLRHEFLRPTDNNGSARPRRAYPRACAEGLTVWSLGIMRSCCDVSPEAMYRQHPATQRQAKGEHAVVDWAQLPIRNCSIVYVPALDMPGSIDRFETFPLSTRITIVSGADDVGIPRELLRARESLRREFAIPTWSVERFVGDARLLGWWVQNYDMLGCNPYSGCAPAGARHAELARKVRPLPIGVDFHTLAEKMGATPQLARAACAQQRDLELVRLVLPRLERRSNTLLAPFACDRPDRMPTCRALRHPNGTSRGHVRFLSGPRHQMWRAMGAHAFVAAPIGHGVDTHRLWEVLALGSVPVVVSSSLDTLYVDFPIIVLGSWAEANASAMAGWRVQITARFGTEPFDARMRETLTTAHWSRRIATQHDLDLRIDRVRGRGLARGHNARLLS
jgi:hypothetical protein